MLSSAFSRIFLLIPSLFSFHQHLNFIYFLLFIYFHLYLVQTYFLVGSICSQKPLKILKMLRRPFLMSYQLHVADLDLSFECCYFFIFRLVKGGQYNSLLKNYFFFDFPQEIAYLMENTSYFKRNDFIDQDTSL